MTRKRSKYRPKLNLKDPVNYVLSGISGLPKDISTTVRTMNHISLKLLQTGEATEHDIGVLLSAFKIALALTHPSINIGADWIPEFKAAIDALNAIAQRPKCLARGPELISLNLAMEVHDLQLDKATVIQVEAALKLLKSKPSPHLRSTP